MGGTTNKAKSIKVDLDSFWLTYHMFENPIGMATPSIWNETTNTPTPEQVNQKLPQDFALYGTPPDGFSSKELKELWGTENPKLRPASDAVLETGNWTQIPSIYSGRNPRSKLEMPKDLTGTGLDKSNLINYDGTIVTKYEDELAYINRKVPEYNTEESWAGKYKEYLGQKVSLDDNGNPISGAKNDELVSTFYPFTGKVPKGKGKPDFFYSREEIKDALAEAVAERVLNFEKVYSMATETDQDKAIAYIEGTNNTWFDAYNNNNYAYQIREEVAELSGKDSGYLEINSSLASLGEETKKGGYNFTNSKVAPPTFLDPLSPSEKIAVEPLSSEFHNSQKEKHDAIKNKVRRHLDYVMDRPVQFAGTYKTRWQLRTMPSIWDTLEQNYTPNQDTLRRSELRRTKTIIPETHSEPMEARNLVAFRHNPSKFETTAKAEQILRHTWYPAKTLDTFFAEVTADAVAHEKLSPLLERPIYKVRDMYKGDTVKGILKKWNEATDNDSASMNISIHAYGMSVVYGFEDELVPKTELQAVVKGYLKHYFDEMKRKPTKDEVEDDGTPKEGTPRHPDQSALLAIKASMEIFTNLPDGFQIGKAPDPEEEPPVTDTGLPPPPPEGEGEGEGEGGEGENGQPTPPTPPKGDDEGGYREEQPSEQAINVGDMVKVNSTGDIAKVTNIKLTDTGLVYELQPQLTGFNENRMLETTSEGGLLATEDEITLLADDSTDIDDQGTDRRGIREDGEPTDEEGEGEE